MVLIPVIIPGSHRRGRALPGAGRMNMAAKSTFEELSSNLTDIERRDMLAKINKSMEGSDGEYYIHVEMEEDDRKRIIHEEIAKLSLWRRFLLWLIKTLTGRERDQVYISMKISAIKRAVKRTSPGLTGFETRELTVKFVKYVYDLYAALFPVKEFYQYYVNEPVFKEQLVFTLLSLHHDQAKNRLDDFINNVELEDVFARENGQQGVQSLLAKRFDEYIKSLPGTIFQKIEADIMPLVAMKNVALFNYKELFQYFDYYLPPSLDKKYPVFRNAPALIVIDHLERLHYSLFYANKNIGDSSALSEAAVAVYVQRRLGLDPLGRSQEREARRDEIGREAQSLIQYLKALIDQIGVFNAQVPLLDIIRYFRRDPYYKFKFYIPQLPLRQIYSQALRKKLKGEVDTRISQIKDRVIDRKIKELFRDLNMSPLPNYNDNASEFYLRLGLPWYSRVKSLTLFYNYVKKIYREFIQEVVQLVSTYFFAGNKRGQTRLQQLASTIEEVEDKILLFDRSLSPEEDDGKTLMRLKYNISTDLTHQKLHKAFLIDKDRDAQALLEKGLEQFAGFKTLFEEIVSTTAEGAQAALKTLASFRNKQYTMGQLVQLLAGSLGDFLKLMNQVMEMEKGRS